MLWEHEDAGSNPAAPTFVVFPCWYGGATVNHPLAGSIPAATAFPLLSLWERPGEGLTEVNRLDEEPVSKTGGGKSSLASSSLAASAQNETNGPVAKRLRQHSYKVTNGGSNPSGTTEPANRNPV